MYWQTWMASPFYASIISSLDINIVPIAIAWTLPSAITATGAFYGRFGTRCPPAEVSPGAKTLLPEKICLIPPLSHCILFDIKVGYAWSILSIGRIGRSLIFTNLNSPWIWSTITETASDFSVLIESYMATSFFGQSYSMNSLQSGYVSMTSFLKALFSLDVSGFALIPSNSLNLVKHYVDLLSIHLL